MRRRLLLASVFFVTFAIVLAGAVLVRSPDLRRRIGEHWTYGTESEGGLLLTLEVAPTGSLSLSYTNVSSEPRALFMPMDSRTGPEIEVHATDEKGVALEPFGPVESGPAASVEIPPGGRFTQSFPIADYVTL
ncbi:MAG TPA: hypothetical protein VFF73_14510, partial [Planctomycetota bacterium]|nr:hypothetical protein [Planctomycetota bacterium]